MMIYLVNNWYESFMIFTTLEKAKEVVMYLRREACEFNEEYDKEGIEKEIDIYEKDISEDLYDDKYWYKNFYIIELQEGQGFGPGLTTSDEFRFIVE